MNRQPKTRPMMAGLLLVLAISSSAFGQASWKLYDLRDLISALPPVDEKRGDGGTGLGRGVGHLPAPEWPPIKDIDATKVAGKNVDDLLNQLCGSMGIKCTRLVAGVYGIEAQDADHARVQDLLEGLRNLYRERYAVELVLIRVPVDQAPAIGAEAQASSPTARHQFVVSRRTPARVAILSISTFLSDVSPVVAQSAVGYAPDTTSVDDGLDVSVLVGSDGDEKDGTSIEVVGGLRRVSWPQEGTDFKTAEGGQIGMKFPVVSVRSVQFHLQPKYGKLMVMGVLAGFEEGQSLVLAASVRKL